MTMPDADSSEGLTAESCWQRTDHDGVAVLTFTRPPSNWMSFAAMTELVPQLRTLADDDGVKVVMLTGGIDGYFVAHADLDDLGKIAAGEPVEGDPRAWREAQHLLETMPQPTVAAIDGQAWGGGNEIALSCTLRVGSERAHMGQPEVAVGILPAGGGTQRLPRLVGAGIGAELCLTGRIVDAAEAHRIGLLNAVLPTDGFVDAAVEWCSAIARHQAPSVFATKRAVVEGLQGPLEDGLNLETQLLRQLFGQANA
ncbi:MAG: enoyl-CoA hydratase/isomerase family protein [Acidimicrobiales bacterium]|nr:enoyl-CoA hydratase/isomerase family protein [Acidimicrobiales bacterium]